MLGFGSLVLCAGTVPSASFEEQVAAAVAAGFDGVSARPRAAFDAIGRAGSADALRRRLGDHGIEVADLDAVTDWVRHPDFRLPRWVPEEDLLPADQVLELAAALGARGVNVVDLSTLQLPPAALADAFAELCDRAAGLGVLVYIEFHPWCGIDSLAAASELVERAGHPANGGVLLDTWHYVRGPSAAGHQIDRHADDVVMVQISDAPLHGSGDWQETMRGRLLPGEGDIDLPGILSALTGARGSAPIGVEVLSDRMGAMAPTDAARKAADATRAVLRVSRPGSG